MKLLYVKQRHNLPFEAKNICNKEIPVSQNFLYGTKANKKLKEVQESYKKLKEIHQLSLQSKLMIMY